MNWWSVSKTAAAKPPAYMMERISDLRHACDLSNRAPGEAKKVVMDVVGLLESHHDNPYAQHLAEAAEKMLDSPTVASEAIMRVVAVMMSEKDEYLAELEAKKNNEKYRE